MKKLLIVDDDRDLLSSLCVVFSGYYNVVKAESAEEAQKVVAETPVDVILLDVMLPGMTGVEFLEKLRKTESNLPVVMLSAAASIKPVIRALRLGACDYIRKPFDVDELRHVVARALKIGMLQSRVDELEEEVARRPVVAEPGAKPMKQAVEQFERMMIEKALAHNGGVQTRAARELGVTRRILRYRMEKLGING